MTTLHPHPRSRPESAATPTRALGARMAAGDGAHLPFGARMRGIDGLRAIAVALVVVFHLSPGAAVGGSVGVDVFFVVSGFLITGLAVREREDTGRLRLGAFWARRARRLLPALAVVVLVASTAALLVGGDVLVGLPRQLLGAGTFSYNWLDIAAGPSYFDQSTPELLRNLWSLAVEEQFYLVWPFVVLALTALPWPRVRAAIALGLAVASGAWMALLSFLGADPSRGYYGTDAHSFGLALGAALAFLVAARTRELGLAARALLGLAGAAALAGVIAIAILVPADSPWMQRGGLQLAALLSALAIAGVALARGPLAWLLDLAPLRWLGVRSYGLYLWHWPLSVLVAAAAPDLEADAASHWMTGVACALAALIAADVSYRLLERPLRRDGLRGSLRALRRMAQWSRRALVGEVVAGVAVAALVTGTAVAASSAPSLTSVQASVAAGEHAIARMPRPTTTASPEPHAPARLPLGELASMPRGTDMTAIGDSVMLAAAPWLQRAYPGILVDAKVSRQMSAGPHLVEALEAKHELRGTLVIGLGTNGPIDTADLDRMRRAAGPDATLVLVTVQAPRGWTPGVNTRLAEYAAEHRNVELADWHRAIRPHLDYLTPDEIHAGGPKGGAIYVGALHDALERLVQRPPLPQPAWLTTSS